MNPASSRSSLRDPVLETTRSKQEDVLYAKALAPASPARPAPNDTLSILKDCASQLTASATLFTPNQESVRTAIQEPNRSMVFAALPDRRSQGRVVFPQEGLST